VPADGPGCGTVFIPDLGGLEVGWAKAGLVCFEGAVLGKPVPFPYLAPPANKGELGLEISVLNCLREWGFHCWLVESTGTAGLWRCQRTSKADHGNDVEKDRVEH
jgi:hypothetical protein